jgi:hypothetical protein
MPAAMAVPMALRFPRRPLLCLLCQAIANCLLGPHPTYGDIALWLVSACLLSPLCSIAVLAALELGSCIDPHVCSRPAKQRVRALTRDVL